MSTYSDNPVTPRSVGSAPAKLTRIRLAIIGYELKPDGAMRIERRQEVQLTHPPDILSRLEVWSEHFLLVSIPFAIGEGHWLWVPAWTEEEEE